MVNTIKFDRQQILELAMLLFWKKGYAATSTRDLQQTTTLKPGSLYSSFGNKQALFSETLMCYTESMKSKLTASLTEHSNPLRALELFIIDILLEPNSTPNKLCFLYKAQLELSHTELCHLPATFLKEINKSFLNCFVLASQQGLLKYQETPEQICKEFQLQFLGWRAYLSINEDEEFIRAAIERFFFPWKNP